MSAENIKCVLLADRHHGLVEGIHGLLNTMFETVVMVADESSLLASAARLKPQVAVVDLSLSRDGTLGWLLQLRQLCPEMKVVVLSVHDQARVRQATLEAGADVFILKRAISEELLPAMEAVLAEISGAELLEIHPPQPKGPPLICDGKDADCPEGNSLP